MKNHCRLINVICVLLLLLPFASRTTAQNAAESTGFFDKTKSIQPKNMEEAVFHISLPDASKYQPLSIPEFKPARNISEFDADVVTYDLGTAIKRETRDGTVPGGKTSEFSLEGESPRQAEFLHEFQVGGVTGAFSDFAPVSDPAAFPWRRNVKVFFSNANGNRVCSGALIHPRYILTAGHCVFSHDNNAGFASSMQVVPAYDNGSAPFGMANAVRFTTFLGWTQNENFDFDMAIVELDRPVGGVVGWFGYGWNSNDSFYSGRTFNNPGYPAAPPFDG